ncbi:MAG: ribosomal protein S18-alanine N-acetyltransferase [Caldicoprobacterales bacterium]|jgi:ribosomal-protein-alanine N-acetyltransferase|nr:ribosomal protein S18-alanine N-acetyltransferase [Clostridiales bacterium]
MKFRVTSMMTEDIDEVHKLEKMCFPIPWSREALRMEVEQNQCARYFSVRADKQLIGYGGMWMILDEAHITNIAVHPDYRRQGVGRLIMETLMKEAVRMGMERMTLEVRVSNKAAVSLYKSLGFEEGGIRKEYYANNREDALIMWNFHIRGWVDEHKKHD